MADEATPETKEGTPLPMPDVPEWENQITLTEPSIKDEEGNDVRKDEKPDEKVEEKTEPEVEDVPIDDEPAPINLLDDPGDFKASDLSFEVVTYDEEGKSPKVTKIESISQWDNLINTDPNFGSGGALLKAQRLATKMENGLEQEQKDWQTKKDAFTTQQEAVARENEALNTLQAEANYLVSKGLLPKIAPELINADWSDPQIAKQSGVKEQLDLLNYMKKENRQRSKAGLKPIGSLIDGFNAMKQDQSVQQQSETKHRASEARKVTASQVAGATPNPVTIAPKGIAVGRTGRLEDLDTLGWNR